MTSLAVLGVGLLAGVRAQPDDALLALFKRVFPDAVEFSSKIKQPPHFNVYIVEPRSHSKILGGFVFWTTEMAPLERGYEGPIKILVGMDTRGILTGVAVVENHEPYGRFSIEPPQFAAQFKDKSIRDAFVVGRDIDAVSRASISVASATRAVQVSARAVARQLLPGEPHQ